MLIDSDSLKDTLKLAFGIRNVKLQADRERDERGIGYRLSEHEFSLRTVYEAILMEEMRELSGDDMTGLDNKELAG